MPLQNVLHSDKRELCRWGRRPRRQRVKERKDHYGGAGAEESWIWESLSKPSHEQASHVPCPPACTVCIRGYQQQLEAIKRDSPFLPLLFLENWGRKTAVQVVMPCTGARQHWQRMLCWVKQPLTQKLEQCSTDPPQDWRESKCLAWHWVSRAAHYWWPEELLSSMAWVEQNGMLMLPKGAFLLACPAVMVNFSAVCAHVWALCQGCPSKYLCQSH